MLFKLIYPHGHKIELFHEHFGMFLNELCLGGYMFSQLVPPYPRKILESDSVEMGGNNLELKDYYVNKSQNDFILPISFIETAHTYKELHESLEEIAVQVNRFNLAIRKLIYQIYICNSNVEKLCIGIEKDTYHYKDLEDVTTEQFIKKLKKFYTYVYETLFPSKAYLRNHYDNLDHYYNDFCTTNPEMEVCAFCGLTDVASEFDDEREAFDHFLNKGKYPFVGINFRNLAPMCHKCNSGKGNKGQKDTLYRKETSGTLTRRDVFYPFSERVIDLPVITVDLSGFHSLAFPNIQNWSLEINPTSDSISANELTTWDEIFNIKERYLKKIKKKLKLSWLKNFRAFYNDALNNEGANFDRDQYLTRYMNILAQNIFDDMSFLKLATFRYLFAQPNFVATLPLPTPITTP